MQLTPNLNLKKPEGTDVVDIADLNANADVLDTEVTKLATTSAAGRMSTADKAKLDGVQAGAQVNTVTSVAGRTGAVTLTTDDMAETTANKVMTAAERTKLAGIATGANNYVHPTGDGNQHVPATGTGNNGRVLKAGSTAGSAAWGIVDWSELGGKPSTFSPTAHTHAASDITSGTIATARLPAASTSATGIVQLNSATNSTSTTQAATASAVKAVKDAVDATPAFMARNAIINGNFDVWQRGTSFSQRNVYTADRWMITDDGGAPSYAVTRQEFAIGQTDVPGSPIYYLKVTINSASTGALVLGQRVENVRSFAGQKVNLSFYAKADSNVSVDTALFQVFGPGGSTTVGLGNTINLSTTWKKFSMNLDIPSISGKTIGTGSDNYLYVEPLRILPSSQTTNFYLAQVQLCAGDVALPYQPRSFADELALCQRYFEKSYLYDVMPSTSLQTNGVEIKVVSSNNIAKGQYYGTTRFSAMKRIPPSITIYPYSSPINTGRVSNSFGEDLGEDSGLVGWKSESSFGVYNNTESVQLTEGNSVIYHWTADAEL